MKYMNILLFNLVIINITSIPYDSHAYSVTNSFNNSNKNNSLFMINVLRFSKSKTKLLSQNGIIETAKSSNYCLYDMCITKIERDSLIRIFFNQIKSDSFTIGNVQFSITEINFDEGYIKSNHGPINCFILKAGNYFLYIAGVNLDFPKVLQEQSQVIDLLKESNDNVNNYIVL